MIDWQRVVLNLRSAGLSCAHVARLTGLDAAHVRRLARGEVAEPRFNSGLRLLDLHLERCGEEHSLDRISAC